MTNLIPIEEKPIPVERNIWNYWPMENSEPRHTQRIAGDWMASQPANVRFLLCQMPVGGGKSPLALTYAGYAGHGQLGTSYILTPQKILQRQYEQSFPKHLLASQYGRANYTCHKRPDMDCDTSDAFNPKCKNSCVARVAFQNACMTPNMVLNYKLALLYSEIYYGGADDDSEAGFTGRDLMVFDECHTLEHHLVSHRAVTITKKRCEELKIKFQEWNEILDAMEWIEEEYHPALQNEIAKLRSEVDRIENDETLKKGMRTPRASEQKTIKRHTRLKRHAAAIERLMRVDPEELIKTHVLVPEWEQLSIKELYGKSLFNGLMRPMANRFLFLSSTILNPDAFCRDLGIKPEESAFIDLDSEFKKENRPVFYMPAAKMSYGWDKKERQSDRDKMRDKIIKLCNMHGDESGIIHSGSFKIGKWIADELKDKIPQEIIYQDPKGDLTRDQYINYYMEQAAQRPMVMISPSLTEGLDLKHDLGRFSIIAKVPYPFLGDAWVKKRMELSEEWYQRQAMINIIQAGGRVVRAADDWGNTYILDESFGFLLFKTKSMTPRWWLNGFKKVGKK
jgi:Rad3-related DNA helicase